MKQRAISILIVIAFLIGAVLAVLGTSISEESTSRFTAPDESSLPTWGNGDFWVYDTTFTTKFAGWADKVWTGDLNYSVQSTTDTSPGYECYRLGMSTEGASPGDPIISGRVYIKKTDLSLVEMNWTETGLDGTTPYTHFHEIYFKTVDYYDYYQFPVMTSMSEVWWVNTTMYEEISNPPGMNHFEISRKDDIKILNQQMGWDEDVSKVQGNYTGQRIDGAENPGNDYDNRYYSPEFHNFLYKEFMFHFNDTGYWTGVQKIIRSNYKPATANEPPEVTNPTTIPDDTAQADDTDQTTLRVTVTDDGGLAGTDPVTVDLTPIGKDAATVMSPGLANTFSVTTAVADGTTGGEKHLYVTATDNQGAKNDTVYITLTVISANNPPVVTNPQANPTSIPNDGTTASLLSANVTDADDNLVNVTINLNSIGGSAQQRMYDDGTNGDQAPGDNVYTYQTVAPNTVTPGTYEFTITADDVDGNVNNTETVSLTVMAWENKAPTLSDAKAEPSTVANNSQEETLLSVRAVDEDGNPLTVKIDLSQIGGNADTALHDDGTHGDIASGDTVYSCKTTVPPTIEAEQYTLVISATDSYDEVFSNIKITIVSGPPNNPPEISGTKADPEQVWNDGMDVVTFEATVEEMDTGQNHTVTIDLSGIGGTATEPMVDDGTGGDEIAGDMVFTAQYGISDGLSAGDYTFKITATDNGAPPLGDTAYVTISVNNYDIPDTTPEISFVSVSPIPVTNEQRNITISAYAVDAEGDYFEVYTDLSGFGGGPRQRLYDDGTHGDLTAGDHTFSFIFQVPLDTANNEYSIRIWVEQDGINRDEEVLTFEVQFDEPPDDDDDDTNKPGSIWDDLPIIILLGALLFVIIIFLVIILRKPKPKEGEEGEEEDDGESQAMVRL